MKHDCRKGGEVIGRHCRFMDKLGETQEEPAERSNMKSQCGHSS